jgi:hypothetical protein
MLHGSSRFRGLYVQRVRATVQGVKNQKVSTQTARRIHIAASVVAGGSIAAAVVLQSGKSMLIGSEACRLFDRFMRPLPARHG